MIGWFCEKINKIDEPLARLIKEKRRKTQIIKLKNEKKLQQTPWKEKKKWSRDYYMQTHVKKMDKLEEMNKFLENCNLQGINQEDHWFDGSLNEPSKSLMKQKI